MKRHSIPILLLVLSSGLVGSLGAQTAVAPVGTAAPVAPVLSPSSVSPGTAVQAPTAITEVVQADVATDLQTRDALSQGINTGPSAVEKVFGKLLVSADQPLKQFGYGITEPTRVVQGANVSPNYLLGPGDQLTILLWGDPVDLGELAPVVPASINRSGGLFFAPVGLVPATGLPLVDVERTLVAGLAKKYKRFELRLTVSQLRQYPILVAGFVNKPGLVAVTAGQGILGILQAAGGVSKNGSLRSIQIRARDGKRTTVDLYQMLLGGLPLSDSLQEGDSIYVPALGPVVAVAGAVQRPAIYEGLATETLADLVAMAGGPSVSSQIETVRLSELLNGQVDVKLFALDDKAFLKRPLATGQLLELFSGSLGVKNGVWVEGAISNPGWFSLDSSGTLTALLPKVGIRVDTDLSQAQVVRIDPVGGKNQVFSFTPSLVLGGAPSELELRPLDQIRFFPSQWDRAIAVSGEVESSALVPWKDQLTLETVLAQVAVKGDPRLLLVQIYDQKGLAQEIDLTDQFTKKDLPRVVLEPGSRVQLTRKAKERLSRSVVITGAVSRPGAYPYQVGVTISDLLAQAGGLTDKAYLPGLILQRQSVVEGQRQQQATLTKDLDQQISDLEVAVASATDPLTKTAAAAKLNAKKNALEVLKSDFAATLGRIRLQMPETVEALKSSKENLGLEEQDRIHIPERPYYITVLGSVYNQSTQAYVSGRNLGEALSFAGGVTDQGDRSKVYVIRANGLIESSSSHSFLLFNNMYGVTLGPGDTVVVPSKDPNSVDGWAVFKETLAVLASSVGLTANSLAIMQTLGVLK